MDLIQLAVSAIERSVAVATADRHQSLLIRKDYDWLLHFQSSSVPSMPPGEYLRRLHFHSRCSESSIVFALVYLMRIEGKSIPTSMTLSIAAKTHQQVYLPSHYRYESLCDVNVHRLLLTAVLIASKFNDDEYFDNKVFAQLGGVSLTELNRLEVIMLQKLKFSLYVSVEQHFDFLQLLKAMCLMKIPSLQQPMVADALRPPGLDMRQVPQQSAAFGPPQRPLSIQCSTPNSVSAAADGFGPFHGATLAMQTMPLLMNTPDYRAAVSMDYFGTRAPQMHPYVPTWGCGWSDGKSAMAPMSAPPVMLADPRALMRSDGMQSLFGLMDSNPYHWYAMMRGPVNPTVPVDAMLVPVRWTVPL